MIELNEEVTEEVTDSVEETTDENQEQPVEEVVEETIDESKFESTGDPDVIKVDLDKAPQVKPEDNITKVNIDEKPTEETVETEQPVMEEITEEETQEAQEVIEEAITESEATGEPLPEGVQKLVEFMNETGGDLNDYVKLNRDIKEMDDSDVLDEYYRETKSHLTPEERSFLLEDNFGYDDSVDDEKEIRKKKIALKEQVAEARTHLDRQKSKYYKEIKAGSKLTQEQQKAIDFFNRYNKESEEQKKTIEASKKSFLNKTNSLFNKNFKGFEYNVGDKKYRFNVKNVDEVKTKQSDINNLVNKYIGEDKSTLEDAAGYHRSLFTAMNADAIAKHFYEQGKADAVKTQIAKDKNINLEPRKTHGEVNVGGIRVRALGESSSEMKNRSFKIRKKN
tara:strand:- start:745 stop:1926 length:1182 start_codon:yes stop_codon:yes gene_type:complete